MALGKSRRGGASAPTACKQALRRCMIDGTSAGGPGVLRRTAKGCFDKFNTCRSKGKRKRTTTRKRKGRKGRR